MNYFVYSLRQYNKNAFLSEDVFVGWLEGIEPSILVPQTKVLPLNYSHHNLFRRGEE